MAKVEQSAEDDGLNVIARRDVHIHNGLTLSDARGLFMDLLSANFPRLRETARQAAEQRCEELFESFWTKLGMQPDIDPGRFERPDVQASIADTLTNYAKSPTGDAGDILGDLLVQRVTLDPEDLKTLVINEALPIAAKLYRRHFDALSLVFLIKKTLFKSVTVGELFGNLAKAYIPVGVDLGITASDVAYMQVAGCLNSTEGTASFGAALMQNYGAMFSWFKPQNDEQHKHFNRLKGMKVCLAESEKLTPLMVRSEIEREAVRFHAPRQVDISVVAEQIPDLDDRQFFQNFVRANQLNEDEALGRLNAYDQRFATIAKRFQLLESMAPTVAGIAIAHANVVRYLPEFNRDLSTWFS